MEDTFTILLATSVGAGISFIAQYIVESRRSKNDKYKFSYEKIISIGERHYEFTGVALLLFEGILNKFQKMGEFESEQAYLIYENAVQIMAEHNESIIDRTHTITSADIYFKISKISVANEMIQQFNFEIATLIDASEGNAPNKEKKKSEGISRIIKLLQDYILIINKDREIIAKTIQSLIIIA
jgi:hypothetical protein